MKKRFRAKTIITLLTLEISQSWGAPANSTITSFLPETSIFGEIGMIYSKFCLYTDLVLPNTNLLILIRQMVTISIIVVVSGHSTAIKKRGK